MLQFRILGVIKKVPTKFLIKIYTKKVVNSYKFFKKIPLFFLSFCLFGLLANTAHGNDITQTDLFSYRPQIHSNGDDFFVVWSERSESSSEVFFSKSNDGGSTFSTPLNISNNPGDSAFPRLAVNENYIFVTWYDYSSGQSDILFAKSSDFGDTFEISNISDNASASYNPWVAANSKFTYLVWNDGGKSQEMEINGKTKVIDVLLGESEIMFGSSNDAGQTFEIKNLSNMSGESINPRIRIDKDNVFVVWTDYGINPEIFFSKSNDSGLTFSTPINISKTDAKSFDSGIQVYGESVFLIWKEKNGNDTEIYFSKSIDGGNSFHVPTSISGNLGNYKITRDTQMSISYPHLYVVYYDVKNLDVHLAHSPDMGDTFYGSVNLSLSTGSSVFSQMVTNENRISVVWNDDSDGDGDVYLRESYDYGHTFGPQINLSDDSSGSVLFVLGPQISKSDDFINVIWENKTHSKSDLSLKQIPINNSPLSFSFSDINAQVSLDGYEIQPGRETQIEIKFTDLQNKDIPLTSHSLIVLDSNNRTIFQSEPTGTVNGIASHSVVFPVPGQYSLKLDLEGSTGEANNQILVKVIPEFGFGIFLILVISFSIAIFSKRTHPRIFR